MDQTVEDRLKSLEDERDFLKTLYTYGHALDYAALVDTAAYALLPAP